MLRSCTLTCHFDHGELLVPVFGNRSQATVHLNEVSRDHAQPFKRHVLITLLKPVSQCKSQALQVETTREKILVKVV